MLMMKLVGILLNATKDWCSSDASDNAEGRREQQEPKCVKSSHMFTKVLFPLPNSLLVYSPSTVSHLN